jgi:glycosyltransferase involved in cell wall biosynthesis
LRIAFLNWKDPWHPKSGGAESYVWEVIKELYDAGHAVTLYTSQYSGSVKSEIKDGVSIQRSGNRFSVYWRVPRLVRKTKHDLVVDVVNTRPFMTAAWKKNVSDPTAYCAIIFQTAEEVWHEETPLFISYLGRYLLEPWWLTAYAKFPTWTISQSSLQSLNGFGLEQVKNLGIGIPDKTVCEFGDRDTDINEDKRSIAYCSRLVPMKRPIDAIKAFEMFHEKIGDGRCYRLEIIGTGVLEEEVNRLAKDSKFEILVHGRVSDGEKNAIFGRSLAILGTSVREGWGLTMSEGAQYGALPVAYNVPGLRDSVAAAGGVLSQQNPFALAESLHDVVVNGTKVDRDLNLGLADWKDIATLILNLESEFEEFGIGGQRVGVIQRLKIFISSYHRRAMLKNPKQDEQ